MRPVGEVGRVDEPQPDDGEQGEPANLEGGEGAFGGLDGAVAGDVDHEREREERDAESGHPEGCGPQVDDLEDVGAERTGHQALAEDHRYIHEQGEHAGRGAGAVRLAEEHCGSARRGERMGELHV